MWNRKELKKQAKACIKRNYLAAIVICFLLAFVGGSFALSTYSIQSNNGGIINNTSDIIFSGEDIYSEIEKIMPDSNEKFRGVLGAGVNAFTQLSGSVTKIAGAARGFFVDHQISYAVMVCVALLLQFLYRMLVQNLFKVGGCRFFLENRIYKNTRIGRIGFCFQKGKFLNSVKVMFFRNLFQMLWMFTIVGGIIKFYSYRMIPYILAENPEIRGKEAFELSKKIMHGNKWRMFMLDLSFFWWMLLTVLTFGLVGFFWLNPYRTSSESELYAKLREPADSLNPAEEYFDKDLFIHAETEAVEPAAVVSAETSYNDRISDLYPGLPQRKMRIELGTHYMQSYKAVSLILLFFTFSVIGWVWEVGLHIVQHGVFVNRGTMFGPWLPIYGTGGVLAIILLKRFFKNPVVTFVAMMVVSGVVEYFTSLYLETTRNVKWWDYSGYILNLNGRICLEGLIVFGLGGCACIYFVAPRLNRLFEKIPTKTKVPVCIALIALFSADVVYSHFHPNIGKGITDYYDHSSGEAQIVHQELIQRK